MSERESPREFLRRKLPFNRAHVWWHSGDACLQLQIRLWRFEVQLLWWRRRDLARGIQASREAK